MRAKVQNISNTSKLYTKKITTIPKTPMTSRHFTPFDRYYNSCYLSLRKSIHALPKGSMKHSKNTVYFHIRDWDDVEMYQIAM